MTERSGRPISISLAQSPLAPDQWRRLLDAIGAANDDGLTVTGQAAPRPVGVLLGLETTLSPFLTNRAYGEIADLPLAARVEALREPERRARVIAEAEDGRNLFGRFDLIFELGDPPNYEPSPADSITARAAQAGVPAAEYALDRLLEDGGQTLLYMPFLNYANGNLEPTRAMIADPHVVPGLADGGAHVGTICDGSFPTTLLIHWGRDRDHGRFELPYLIQRQCRDTARTVGLLDRGVLAPGYRADVNVIDFDRLRLHLPELHHDLPAGGRRFLQRVDGYRHTFVAGEETYRDGEATGALPGRLVRGATGAPAAAGGDGATR